MIRPAAFLLAASGLTGLLAGPAPAQGVVRNSFGDWQVRCETPAGARAEQCAIVQNVAAEDRPSVTLVIMVFKTADGKSRLLRVIAPLGILLPAGLGLKIDQTDVGRAGFVRCLSTGCVAAWGNRSPRRGCPCGRKRRRPSFQGGGFVLSPRRMRGVGAGACSFNGTRRPCVIWPG